MGKSKLERGKPTFTFYKLFSEIQGKKGLYPWFVTYKYPKSFHKTKWNHRKKGWGPFSCFKTLEDIKDFLGPVYLKEWRVFKIEGVLSEDTTLYTPLEGMGPPPNTILLDKFRITEENPIPREQHLKAGALKAFLLRGD